MTLNDLDTTAIKTIEQKESNMQTGNGNMSVSTDQLSDIEKLWAEDDGLGHNPDEQGSRIIVKLEPGSAAVIGNNPEGAEAGMFLAGGELHEDLKNVLLCGVVRYYVEWLPGRQGGRPQDRHPEIPAGTTRHIEKDGTGKKKELLICENGNILQETRYCHVLFNGGPYTLPLTSTGHQLALDWQSYARKLKHPKTGRPLPIFAHRYRLFTRPVSGKSFHWHEIRFEDLGPLTDPDEYLLARKLCRTTEQEQLRIAELRKSPQLRIA
jgi:hypothetical protein